MARKKISTSFLIVLGIVAVVGVVMYSVKVNSKAPVNNDAAVAKSQQSWSVASNTKGTEIKSSSKVVTQTMAASGCQQNQLCVDLKIKGQDGTQNNPVLLLPAENAQITWSTTNASACAPWGTWTMMGNSNTPKLWNFLNLYPNQNYNNTNNTPAIYGVLPVQSSLPSTHYNLSSGGLYILTPNVSNPGQVGITCYNATGTASVTDTVWIKAQ